jgi:hypothetical protein
MSERPACPEAKGCTHSPYLKVCPSCLREEENEMNGKIGMWAFPMLLAGLLVSVVVVSMASAQTSIDAIAEEELADSVIITPDFSSQDIVVSPSLGEDDLITYF